MPQANQPGAKDSGEQNEEQTPKTLTEADVGNMVNRAVSAHITRFTEKTLPGLLESSFKTLAEKLTPPAPQPKAEGEGEGEGGTKKKSKQDPETAALAKTVEDLKKQIEDRDKAVAAEQKKFREEKGFNALKGALAEKVRPELLDVVAKMLFHVDQKVTYDEQGNPLFKSKDSYGDEVTLPIGAGVDEFLKSDTAKPFLPAPSAGNAGGALPKTRTAAPAANPNAQPGTGSDAERVQRALQNAQRLAKATGIPNT